MEWGQVVKYMFSLTEMGVIIKDVKMDWFTVCAVERVWGLIC